MRLLCRVRHPRGPMEHPPAEHSGKDASLGSWLRHPQTTVRWRLTLLYGGMFLVCGAALLAVTYALVSHGITGGSGIEIHPSPTRASGAKSPRFTPPLPQGGFKFKLPPPN